MTLNPSIFDVANKYPNVDEGITFDQWRNQESFSGFLVKRQ